MVIKCKMCGGDLSFDAGSTVCECEFCGSKQTLPNADNEKKVNLFNRANRLRMNNEFDKAATVYESIVAEFPEEAEAYWGLCLCAYGIEYVDDPATLSKIPTCHRTLPAPIMEDPNFEQACDYADAIARRVYRDEAKAIDRIQKDILSIAAKETPYDVFICYKELDDFGSRTEDSVIAQEIYDALTEKNFKVFFSRITLEDKLGVQYEPYIYAALSSAKVMLAVGTKFEYYDAVWVKNEWRRFLGMMKSDKSKTLIPCFKDLDAYDIPKEMSGFLAQDLGKLGWKQDLVRAVEKLCGKAPAVQSVPVIKQVVSSSDANTEALLKRAFMFLEDENWEDADDYCEKVLDRDPENARAYLGKLMAECEVCNREELGDCAEPFDDSNNYKKAMRFGDKELTDALSGYIVHINERSYNAAINKMKSAATESAFNEAANIFASIPGFKDADEKREQCVEKRKNIIHLAKLYEEAKQTMNSAKTDSDFQKAAEQFQNISSFNDSAILEKQCLNRADGIKHALELAEIIIDMEKSNADESIQITQEKLAKFPDIALQLSSGNAELNDLKTRKNDVEQKISELQEARSKLGLFAVKEKKAKDAKIAEHESELTALRSEMTDCRAKLLEYMSKRLCELCPSLEIRKGVLKKNPKIKSSSRLAKLFAEPGDIITFGSYPYANSQSRSPIEWLVLDTQDNKILVISKYGLDAKPYNKKYVDITWEKCTLRSWLNDDFYNAAFNADEKKAIVQTEVSADKNPEYSTNPGNDTTDNVFLLSINEANKYFSSASARQCAATDYAIEQGAYTNSDYKVDGGFSCWWWLRSPGSNRSRAASVHHGGSVSHYDRNVNHAFVCVRPALWINLEA